MTMKYITSSKSISSKATGIVGTIFLTIGLLLILADPANLFFWGWALLILTLFLIWAYQYYMGHEWILEITKDYILFESPFYPKSAAKIRLQDITEIKLSDGEITSGTVFMNNGEAIRVPGQCLPRVEEIAKRIKDVGAKVSLNGQQIN